MASYLRLRQICLVAPHLEPVVGDIAGIMGLSVCYRDGNVAKYGLENALLPVDTILLEVVAPIVAGTAAGRFIDKTGGRGGYMAIFCCDDPDERARHAREIGVRVANVIDHAPYHGVQLHPRDCRAAFIEFNHTEGSDDILGPYPPAGPDWHQIDPQGRDAGPDWCGNGKPAAAGAGRALGQHHRNGREPGHIRRSRTRAAELQFSFREGRERYHERVDVPGERCRCGARCRDGKGVDGVGRFVLARRRDVPDLWRECRSPLWIVMPGLVPGIHVL